MMTPEQLAQEWYALSNLLGIYAKVGMCELPLWARVVVNVSRSRLAQIDNALHAIRRKGGDDSAAYQQWLSCQQEAHPRYKPVGAEWAEE